MNRHNGSFTNNGGCPPQTAGSLPQDHLLTFPAGATTEIYYSSLSVVSASLPFRQYIVVLPVEK